VIPMAKVRALREGLERDGEVRFANGSVVRMHRGARLLIEVERPAKGRSGFTEDELSRAYEMALNGPRPKQQPSGDPGKYGEEAPWSDEDLEPHTAPDLLDASETAVHGGSAAHGGPG
jgi:hypothetical protein